MIDGQFGQRVWAFDETGTRPRFRTWRLEDGRFGFQLIEYRNSDGLSRWDGKVLDGVRRFVYDFGAGRWVEYYKGSTFSDSQSIVVEDTPEFEKWLLSKDMYGQS